MIIAFWLWLLLCENLRGVSFCMQFWQGIDRSQSQSKRKNGDFDHVILKSGKLFHMSIVTLYKFIRVFCWFSWIAFSSSYSQTSKHILYFVSLCLGFSSNPLLWLIYIFILYFEDSFNGFFIAFNHFFTSFDIRVSRLE